MLKKPICRCIFLNSHFTEKECYCKILFSSENSITISVTSLKSTLSKLTSFNRNGKNPNYFRNHSFIEIYLVLHLLQDGEIMQIIFEDFCFHNKLPIKGKGNVLVIQMHNQVFVFFSLARIIMELFQSKKQENGRTWMPF